MCADLAFDDLRVAVCTAEQILVSLRQRHARMDACLVIARRGAQVRARAGVHEFLTEFPAAFVDSSDVVLAIETLRRVLNLEGELRQSRYVAALARLANRQEAARAATQRTCQLLEELSEVRASLERITPLLRFRGNLQIELRFGDLDFALVAALQRDLLVDRELTPQTSASIRIVIGRLTDLLDRDSKRSA
jgi:hypothetical protein